MILLLIKSNKILLSFAHYNKCRMEIKIVNRHRRQQSSIHLFCDIFLQSISTQRCNAVQYYRCASTCLRQTYVSVKTACFVLPPYSAIHTHLSPVIKQ